MKPGKDQREITLLFALYRGNNNAALYWHIITFPFPAKASLNLVQH